jgi:uncharacterized protein YdeI (YjbR/CyaY-like superfamily)
MGKRDARVDAYIDKSAAFAKPILREMRERVHAACPDIEETIKWSIPSFVYAGRILAHMAAFKQHASFGFWKRAEVVGEAQVGGMGSYGKLASVNDLPPKRRMQADIKRAMKLNEDGGKASGPRKSSASKPPPQAPEDLLAALAKNRKAKATFDAFPPSARRDYVDWIVEAKREQTRHKRLAQAVEWMAEGKRRHWKYETC